ncbi:MULTISPECIES: pentapeptide repeat-containing protein [unclassified Streptomyces]|uniref:pentapeptide repeat-containing protein n=1 Tax=unclassified Streptomyces TaxID=2593676 RepID=UPI0035E1D4B7
MPGHAVCLAHLTDADRDAHLAGLAPGSDIDHRGTPLTEDLLRRLLRALVVGTTGRAEIGDARFDEAVFHGEAGFSGARFTGEARFSGARFTGSAGFHLAEFSGAWFDDVQFSGAAHFGSAIFSCHAHFVAAQFSGAAWFEGAKFSRDAWFVGARFPAASTWGPVTCATPRRTSTMRC